MNSSDENVLKIQHLQMGYPNSKELILDGLDLKVGKGESVALIGMSGSGKSTLSRVLLNILPQGCFCAGDISVNGRNFFGIDPQKSKNFRGQTIGLVFQDPMTRLNPLMTIGDHILDTLKAHKPHKSSIWHYNKAKELLIKVGIDSSLFNCYPHEFSGGMRQRVAIALAIALNPPLIIADEPTSSLDVVVASRIMRELKELCLDLGSALLLITHDIALALRWCDRISILHQGKIIEESYSNSFVKNPKSIIGKELVDAARIRELNSHKDYPFADKILEVEELRCWHSIGGYPWKIDWVKAINGVSFSLSSGETLGVVGLSGCGKSTLCRALLGLNPIRGGVIKFMGRNISQLNNALLKESRKLIQLVFQDPFASLNPKMTVLDIISDPFLIHGLCSVAVARERTRSLLCLVGLNPPEKFMNRFPKELSGGQQQRVAIARAIALEPRVLICDESISMLDYKIQADILDLLRQLQTNLKISILFITHDLSVASSFCHRIILLDKGSIVEEGTAGEIFQNPQSDLAKELAAASPRITEAF